MRIITLCDKFFFIQNKEIKRGQSACIFTGNGIEAQQ